jgi:tetratricopeptide (TPR) repeat protein
MESMHRAELARAKHQQALELMDKQHLDGALRLFGEALAQEETCERWNDWAVAQFTLSRFGEAEQGFRYALELDAGNLEVAGNLGVLLVECEREHEAIPFLQTAASAANEAVTSRSTAEVLLAISRDTVTKWRAEFEKQLRETPVDVAEIPRWPLGKYALRLAQLGQFENALEMVTYNRHFQPADAELIRMEAVLRTIVTEPPERARTAQGTTPA